MKPSPPKDKKRRTQENQNNTEIDRLIVALIRYTNKGPQSHQRSSSHSINGNLKTNRKRESSQTKSAEKELSFVLMDYIQYNKEQRRKKVRKKRRRCQKSGERRGRRR